jgi:hypothetical protein
MMIGLIPIMVLGTLILILGARLVVQATTKSRTQLVSIEDYSAARAALDSVFAETAAVKRVFAKEDGEFISRTGGRDVQHFFRKERNKLAIEWLRTTQRRVTRLMDLHLKLASYTTDPRPGIEFSLTVKYLFFLLTSNVLLVLLRFREPSKAVAIVSHPVRVSEHFCTTVSLQLEKIDPEKLGRLDGQRLAQG